MKFIKLTALFAASLFCAAASASVTPDSYSMLNGNTGSYTYWDDSYTGAGCLTCDNDGLSGGKGDLTDGVIATSSWYVTEPAGHGPYVGWTTDPTIVFHWNTSMIVNSMTFYLDDADGYGGVSAPASITINGNVFAVTDPAGPAPFAFTATGLNFSGTDLTVTLNRSNAWVFLSEVSFDGGTSVPEPASILLLLAGAAGIAASARRRKSA